MKSSPWFCLSSQIRLRSSSATAGVKTERERYYTPTVRGHTPRHVRKSRRLKPHNQLEGKVFIPCCGEEGEVSSSDIIFSRWQGRGVGSERWLFGDRNYCTVWNAIPFQSYCVQSVVGVKGCARRGSYSYEWPSSGRQSHQPWSCPKQASLRPGQRWGQQWKGEGHPVRLSVCPDLVSYLLLTKPPGEWQGHWCALCTHNAHSSRHVFSTYYVHGHSAWYKFSLLH